MTDRQIKNEKGFTLVEMLISMALGIVVLGAAIYTYTRQDSLLRDENTNVQLRDHARLAMDDLVSNLRLIGSGLPPGDSTLATPRPAYGITNADVNTITYRANMDNITTFAARDSAAAATGIAVPLNSANNIFGQDDTVIFFEVNTPTNIAARRVSSVDTNVNLGDPVNYDIIWMDGVAHGFALTPVANGSPVVINKFRTITVTYNTGPQTITVTDNQGTVGTGDDTTTTIAINLANVTFSYFDDAGVLIPNSVLPLIDPTSQSGLEDNTTAAREVRRLQVSLTVADATDSTMTTTLATDIHLRNMGI